MTGMQINNMISAKGLSKTHVAAMVGIHRSTLSRIIRGNQSYVSQSVMNKIEVYLRAVNTDDKKILENNVIIS